MWAAPETGANRGLYWTPGTFAVAGGLHDRRAAQGAKGGQGLLLKGGCARLSSTVYDSLFQEKFPKKTIFSYTKFFLEKILSENFLLEEFVVRNFFCWKNLSLENFFWKNLLLDLVLEKFFWKNLLLEKFLLEKFFFGKNFLLGNFFVGKVLGSGLLQPNARHIQMSVTSRGLRATEDDAMRAQTHEGVVMSVQTNA